MSVHVLGDELSAAAKRIIEEGCRRSGAADLVFHDLEEILPRQRLLGNWPRAILGRLWIPELIDGRVLYLDGDTCTFADISPLFEMDMGGSLLGCVRDFGKLDCFEREYKREDTKYVEELMAPFPRHDYFNSGVLLFDCDGIRRNDEVRSRITRTENLETCFSPDQDHLNAVFKNKTLLLHPSWNSFYGLDRHAVRLCKRLLPPEEVHDFRSPRIIHYVDGPKPWSPFEIKWLPKTSIMVKRFPRFIEYKLNARRLLAPYKAAIDETVLAHHHAPPQGGKRVEGGVARNNVQIALCADMANLRHAWIAMASAIECASAPVTVHLLGDGLTSGAVERLEAACRELADARLKHHNVTDILAATRSMAGDSRTVTGATLLPQLVEGRVLYLDSDTMTCADVRPLFEIDMGTAAVGSVRNYSLLGRLFEKHRTQRSEFDVQVDLAKIIHFTGARKPWDPLGSWCLSMSGAKMLPAVYRYRMAERRLPKFLGEGNIAER